MPRSKQAPARTRATRWGAFTARQRAWAASISLNAMAMPAALDPGPLVTLVRCRTVANVDSIGFVTGMKVSAPARLSDRSSVWRREAGEYGATVRDEGCWEKQVGQAVLVRWAGSPC